MALPGIGICCLEADEEQQLAKELGEGYTVHFDDGEHEDDGHHSWDSVVETADGRFFSIECGSCSCQGSGSYSEWPTLEKAMMQCVPEWRRGR